MGTENLIWAFHTTFTLREAALALAGTEKVDDQVKGIFRERRRSVQFNELLAERTAKYPPVNFPVLRTTGWAITTHTSQHDQRVG